MKDYKINDIYEGTIINIRDFGAIMIFEDDRKGLLHISEVANVFIRNIHKYLKIGKTYQVKIIGIEEDIETIREEIENTDDMKELLKSIGRLQAQSLQKINEILQKYPSDLIIKGTNNINYRRFILHTHLEKTERF